MSFSVELQKWEEVKSRTSIKGKKQVLFSLSINDLAKGADASSASSGNTKLGGAADNPECCAALQRDFDTLERWAGRSCLKFSNGKCRLLHLQRNNLTPQYRLRAGLLERGSAEKELRVLMDKLSSSQKCVLVAKKVSWGALGITLLQAERDDLALHSALVRPHLEFCARFLSPHYNRDKELLEWV